MRHHRRPHGRQQHGATPAQDSVKPMRKFSLEHGERDNAVQIQTLDKHPHKHGRLGVLQQHVRGLAQNRCVLDARHIVDGSPDDRLIDVHREAYDHLDAHGNEEVAMDARAIVAQRSRKGQM